MLAWTDRFKADVTVSGGTEVFSWAVPQRFQSEDVEKILSRGMTGSGDFGPFLMSIFDREAARYEYQGLESRKGQDLAVYRYRVPGSSSHYQVRVGPKAQDLATLAYEGRFWIDPRTAELVRMTIEVPRPPRQAQTCRIETTIDYRRARIGASDFLLPLSTVVRLSDPEGQRYENRIEYASCREFQSESVFRTDVDLPSGPAATPKPPLPIGPGALVRVALRSRIDSETAFAGDAIEGRLVNPIGMLVPEGATVHGRIMRLEQEYQPSKFFTLALKFYSVDAQGAEVPLNLVAETHDSLVEPDPEERRQGIGVFVFRGERLALGKEFVSEWKTVQPRH
jgi:hypothetical protein